MKTGVVALITLSFILVFTLRGGTAHQWVNFSFLFAAVVSLAAPALALGYLCRKRREGISFSAGIGSVAVERGELYLVLWAALLTGLALCTYFYSPAPPGQFAYKAAAYIMMHYTLVFFYFLSLDTAAVKRIILTTAVISIPLLFYQQLYSYFTTGSMVTYPYSLTGRAHGLLVDPNEFAKNIIVVLLILFYYILMERVSLFSKIIFFGSASFLLLLLVWSGSRGGFVMLLLAGGLFWLMLFRKIGFRRVWPLYAVIGAAAVLFIIFMANYDLLSVRFTGFDQDEGVFIRFNVAAMFFQFVFGSGAFNHLFGYGLEFWPAFIPFSTTPHNFLMEYLVEFGLVLGLLILGTLAFVLALPLVKVNHKYARQLVSREEYLLLRLLFIIAVSSCVPSLFNHSLTTNMTFIFFTGLYLSFFRYLGLKEEPVRPEPAGVSEVSALHG